MAVLSMVSVMSDDDEGTRRSRLLAPGPNFDLAAAGAPAGRFRAGAIIAALQCSARRVLRDAEPGRAFARWLRGLQNVPVRTYVRA